MNSLAAWQCTCLCLQACQQEPFCQFIGAFALQTTHTWYSAQGRAVQRDAGRGPRGCMHYWKPHAPFFILN